MTLRIWYQSLSPLGRFPNYADAIRRHAIKVLGDSAAVHLNGASGHWYANHLPSEVLKYPYAKHVIQMEAIDLCRRAESEGYDAVILGSFSEPFLSEIRSLLDIPVISMAETSMLVACSLATQFAMVVVTPAQAIRLREIVKRHSMLPRVTAFLPLAGKVSEADLEAAIASPALLAENFTAVARQAALDGAGVVIPAEGLLAEALFWHGVHEVDGATIMDCVGASFLHAEMLIKLRRKSGVSVGRRGAYAKPPADVLAVLDRNGA